MPLQSRFPAIQIPQENLLSFLFPPGEEVPDTPQWIDAGDDRNSLSLPQLHLWAKRLALGLNRLGVPRGTVVMVYTPNHILIPAAFVGIAGSGRIFSGANPAFTLSEITYQIKDAQAEVILAHPTLLTNAIAAAQAIGLPKSRVFQFSDRWCPPRDGVRDWREMLGSVHEASRYQVPPMTPEEATTTVAAVNYSSGTTGVPKGVCLSHYNLIANLAQLTYMDAVNRKPNQNAPSEQRWIGFLPLYHVYGQIFTILVAAKLRIPVYVMNHFSLTSFLNVIQTKRITNLHAVPPILVMLAKRPEVARYDLSSLREIFCAAAPLSKELQNDVSTRFGVSVTQGWGMTEVTCGGVKVPAGISDDSGSIGVLLPNCEAKLLDEDHKEVGPGERGELYLRGPNVCLGYWRNEPATRDLFDAEGWLRSGDVAIHNKEDWFWIVDRKKELIKVNGIQVAPAELEAVLLEHPHIADAAVVGITLHDEEYPRAYVALKENSQHVTDASIHAWMKQRVAKHKYLVGGIAFVDEVPKLASGKIMRKVMREWAKRDAPLVQRTVKARL